MFFGVEIFHDATVYSFLDEFIQGLMPVFFLLQEKKTGTYHFVGILVVPLRYFFPDKFLAIGSQGYDSRFHTRLLFAQSYHFPGTSQTL